jgi:hypothetical protein
MAALVLAGCSSNGGPEARPPTPAAGQTQSSATIGPPGYPGHAPEPIATAVGTPLQLPAASVTPTSGTLSGRVCFPVDRHRGIMLYFLDFNSGEVTEVMINADTARYSVSLPAGSYTAFGWHTELGFGYGVSNVVSSEDGEVVAESVHPIEVFPGTNTRADLCDPLPFWVQPPVMPGASVSPAGLVYESVSGLEIIDAAGQRSLVFSDPGAALSPDGSQVLYARDDDIWIADLATGARRNLTNTPDRIEHSPQWWPARLDLIVFSSHEIGSEGSDFGPRMFPTVANLDGSGYRVIEAERDAWSVALSPDGDTMAYGSGPTGWLYNFSTDRRTAFDAADYGVPVGEQTAPPSTWSVASPAFAPDGRRMTWLVGQFFADGNNQIYQGFFDLEARSAHLWHPHQLPGMDGLPPRVIWSPDGEWVAVFVWSHLPGEQGLWIVSADGERDHYLGPSTSARFSPDSQWLAFTDGQDAANATRLGTWDVVALPRPEGAMLVDWR